MVKVEKSLSVGIKIIIGLEFFYSGLLLFVLIFPPFRLPLWFTIIDIVFILMFLAIGIGLIKRLNLARIGLIATYVLQFAGDFVLLFLGISDFGFQMLVRDAVGIVVIIYVTKPHIKKLFH